MPSPLRKSSVVLLALLAAFALGACGDSHTKVSTGTYAGESGQNAPYLNVGPLIYEVQLSRELNPANVEDATYLQGLSLAQGKLAPGEEWFGVFIQVYNNTPAALPAATSLTITDTQDKTYTPLTPERSNPFIYGGGLVPAKGELPAQGSIAAAGATQGMMLLYKIQIVSLDNRPLELKIVDPLDAAQTASAELDV
jgi:hypothetical protein